ncbi:MAG: hypothetical protein Alpg2KO_22290 [Alphaproteobacteria bacterium]
MSKPIVIAALLGVAVLGGGALIVSSAGEGRTATAEMPTYAAQKRDLLITIKEAGQLKAKDQIVLKSEVSGQAAILSLVSEGTRVEKGDLLVELDSSNLQDELTEQEIRVQNAETGFIQAREQLAITRSAGESSVEQAENDLRFARSDLEVYKTGDAPRALMELQSNISLAEEEQVRAQRQVEGSRRLLREKFISATELEADELSLKKADLNLVLAKEDLRLFEQHTRPRQIAELEANLSLLDAALDRAKAQASSNILQAEADLSAREAELTRQRNKLARIKDQIAKSRIIAPREGLVVYATSTRASWRGNEDPLAEGQSVRERQELIHLPTADGMIAVIRVPESRLRLVRPGLPVQMSVDALPGQVFNGTVKSVAVLPDAAAQMLNPDLKVYDTVVELTDLDPALRTGMGVQAEIIAAQSKGAIVVPIQAVQRSGRQAYVFVQDGQGWVPQKVETGLDDLSLIEIKQGVEEGQIVSLAPPLDKLPAPEIQSIPDGLPDVPDTANTATEQAAPASEGRQGRDGRRQGRGDRSGDRSEGRGQGEDGGRRGGRWANMSEEERAAMRERFRNMSEEDRNALRQRFRGGGGE